MLKEKQFSSFDVAAVVYELREAVSDCRVRNIYQIDDKIFLFKLRRHNGRVFRLILESGKRFHLTSYSRDKPKLPPAFCMALRKYLRNSRLIHVEQYEFERVVIFTFKTWSGEIRLYLELFGGGNIILADQNGKIMQALEYRRMRDRNILRGETFEFAPSVGKNPFNVNRIEFVKILKGSGNVEVVKALAKTLGIGGFYAEEVLLRASVEKKTKCNELGNSALNAIFEELQGLLSMIVHGEFEPCIILDGDGDFLDVELFRLAQYEGFNHKCYEKLNEALDEYYVRISAVERTLSVTSEKVERLENEVERLKRIIEKQERTLAEAEVASEINKRIGDTIYAHNTGLEALHRKFLERKKEGRNLNDVVSQIIKEKKAGEESSMFFESFDEKHMMINVNLDGLRFSLSLRRSLFDNAARFYKMYKRAKQKLKGAQTALDDTRKKLKAVETSIKQIQAAEKISPNEVIEEVAERKIRRKRWFEKYHWFISSDEFLVVAGKDAVSNEVLVKKYTQDEDLVFHADVIGAPFVVVKTEGKKPSEKCLQQAATFAASFSRGWREDFVSVDVYWVKPEQLSKSAPSGEYVPRGGFVVRGRRNWMRGVPLKLAIGVIEEENGKIRFIGGPVSSVKAKTDKYVTIIPGNLKCKALSKCILNSLTGKMPRELQEKVSKSSFEEIRGFIPYNKGRIWEG